MRNLVRMTTTASIPALVLAFAFVAPAATAAAVPARALPCHASMSNSHPADFTTTIVRVRSVARASVTTVAHYRTTNTTHHGRTNASGRAGIPYRISGATPGFQVKVDVTVKKARARNSRHIVHAAPLALAAAVRARWRHVTRVAKIIAASLPAARSGHARCRIIP